MSEEVLCKDCGYFAKHHFCRRCNENHAWCLYRNMFVSGDLKGERIKECWNEEGCGNCKGYYTAGNQTGMYSMNCVLHCTRCSEPVKDEQYEKYDKYEKGGDPIKAYEKLILGKIQAKEKKIEQLQKELDKLKKDHFW